MTRISPIYHQGPSPEPKGKDAEHRNMVAYQTLWHERGVAVINPDDVTDDWERQTVINIANQQYGRRAE
ncbi:hypothetical protein [uncultured Roseobacter sp.]|uniref:hypothetical protein n=1 Tax=uncultured Roseobacter sp. TaxID=114847 RepID=UPI0026361585|nr:hypothetical protein [uncultured Roseobacter sp.]